MFKKKKRGFTLAEVLVSVTIIVLLVTLSIVATLQLRVRSRDAKRVSDVTEIMNALESYYAANKAYPTVITAGQPIMSGSNMLLKAVPNNPSPRTDGGCADQGYTYTTTTTGYKLTFCIGANHGRFAQGTVICKNGNCGVKDAAECGGSVTITDRDGNVYPTVQIGTQCWMGANLRTKVKPDTGDCVNVAGGGYLVSGAPACTTTSGGIVYGGFNGSKRDCVACSVWNGAHTTCTTTARGLDTDCYSNPDISNAGAIYTWSAAMNGSTVEGSQGLCPDGWHVPTDAEWYTLESFLTTPPVNSTTCNPTRLSSVLSSCSSAGSKLIDPSPSGSGFKAALIGGRVRYSVFDHFGLGTDYWTSTWHHNGLGSYSMLHDFYIVRTLSVGDPGVFRMTREDIDAFPVRCIKNPS